MVNYSFKHEDQELLYHRYEKYWSINTVYWGTSKIVHFNH